MGLFKKRTSDPEELEQLKAAIAAMSARLAASDEAKSQLEGKVHSIATRLDTPISPPPTAPPPAAAPSVGTVEIDKLNAKLERLSRRIDEFGSTSDDTNPPTVDPEQLTHLRALYDDLARQFDEARAAPANEPDAPSIEQLDGLQARLDELAHRLEADASTSAHDHEQIERLDATMTQLGQRLEELDGRITAISTELANQITELSAEIGESEPDGQSAATELVGELRDAQERLANEQARYQIAFRQDLADLVEQLKRT